MRKNVLLVLQNGQESGAVSENLQPEFNFFVAREMEKVWPIIESASIQLIICNVNMPALNGWELCARLKSSPRYSHIPIILITGEDSLQSKIRSLEVGADAHVIKPVSSKYLEALMNNLIINRMKISEYFAFSHQPANGSADLNNDDDFINKLNELISVNIHNSSLNVNLLARQMNMSRPTLYRRIKNFTDVTPTNLILNARLMYATQLLGSGNYKVFEISNMVGFQSQSSFGKAFIKQFKVTPKKYLQIKKQSRLEHTARVPKKHFLFYETAIFTC